MGGEWTTCTVADLAAKTRNAIVGGPFGSDLVSRDYVSVGIPVIRGVNMAHRWVGGEFVFVSAEKSESLAANHAEPGDVVFTQRGTLGQVALVPEQPYARYLVSQSQMKLTVDRQQALPLFLYYVFRSAEQQDYIRKNAIQTGVPHTNLGLLKSTPILLPPIVEQRAIARILGALDDKIELNRKMNATLEAMARALFKSWFIDFDPVRAKSEGRTPSGMDPTTAALFPNTFTDSPLGPIPKGWSVAAIGVLAEVVGGSTPSTAEPAFWENGIHHWATPKDLSALSTPVIETTERRITDEGLRQIGSGLLPVGTVLLSSRAPIGYLGIAEVPLAVNQGFIAMKPQPGIPAQFLLRWLEAAHEEIVSRANGSTFLEISKSNFRPIQLVRPSRPVLDAFHALTDGLYRRVVTNERQSRSLARTRDELLPRLLSGELSTAAYERTAPGFR